MVADESVSNKPNYFEKEAFKGLFFYSSIILTYCYKLYSFPNQRGNQMTDVATSLHNGSWREKVLEADKIWMQVKALLDAAGMTLPKVPRRPDVRLILDNLSGHDVHFLNPANHANHKLEDIPGAGLKKAVMVMLVGDTLENQQTTARLLYDLFDLGKTGLSAEFLSALRDGYLTGIVAEAYGPSVFEEQTGKLKDLDWKNADGFAALITPCKGDHAAYGARPAENETAFLANFLIYVRGTSTVPELAESGMVIAVNVDYKTKVETTRPIVPSVAKGFYGAHFAHMPCVKVDVKGIVESVDLGNGTVIRAKPSSGPDTSAAPTPAFC